jgi:hypothetical protein
VLARLRRPAVWRSHGIDDLLEGLEVGRAPAGGGIPALDGGEASGLGVRVDAVGDVLEGLGVGIDERIEESERRLALGEEDGVQACEDGRNDRASRRGADFTR